MANELSRRDMLKAGAAALIGMAIISTKQTEAKPMNKSGNVTSKWSELPALLEAYEAKLDAEENGVSRIFGYASIIAQHEKEKPAGSAALPNENARLPGMEVAMNVYAAGEYEFRGTRGEYQDKSGKTKHFANVGVYAGLEPASSPDGFAMGKTITANKADRRESLAAYIERELGDPPAGLKAIDLFDPKARAKFEALAGTKDDEFGMYKLHITDVEITDTNGKRRVPAVTVSTNENSKFAAIGMTPMQTAQLILDGKGYVRDNGKKGGLDLDYFKKSVIGVARENNLTQPRLEAIDVAIDQLAKIYVEADRILEQKIPEAQIQEQLDTLVANHPELAGNKTQAFHKNGDSIQGLFSPYFRKGNVNKRSRPTDIELAAPENNMPHTAEEKFAFVAKLVAEGKTKQTSER